MTPAASAEATEVVNSYTLDRIRSTIGSLTASEERVARAILDHPFDALTWSAVELAARSGTSDATAVRTCRRLGFTGLRELRLTLARDLGWPTSGEPAMPVAGRHSVIGEIFEDAVRSLSTMVTKTTDDQFRRAVKMLTKARRIFVVSNGPSVIFAQDFANYSQLCGLQTEFWPDTIMQNVVASKLGTKDVCVGVSLSGGNALTVGGVETAAAAGAKVLAVTGYQRSPLVDLAKVAVVAETFDFSTIGQAAINSAAMLLTLRSLVIATANEVYASATAGTQHFHASQSTLGRFAYRQPEGQANGAAKWRVR